MNRLLSFKELKEFGIPYSKSHLYFLMNKDQFPKPLKLSTNTVAWIKEDIQNWIENKIINHRNEQGV